MQMKPPAHKGVSHPNTNQHKLAGMRVVPDAAPRKSELVCFGCGKPGHISLNCPRQDRQCAAAARMEGEDGEKEDPNGPPEETTQKEDSSC